MYLFTYHRVSSEYLATTNNQTLTNEKAKVAQLNIPSVLHYHAHMVFQYILPLFNLDREQAFIAVVKKLHNCNTKPYDPGTTHNSRLG